MSFARLRALVGGHAHELLALDQTGLIDEQVMRLASAVQAVGKQTGKGLVKRVRGIIGVEEKTINRGAYRGYSCSGITRSFRAAIILEITERMVHYPGGLFRLR